MKNIIFASLLLASVPTLSSAQDLTPPHQISATPPNSHFEVVQSEIAARWTFRLDRFTGNICQIVSNKEGELVWRDMPIRELPKAAAVGHAHYQIFLSSIAVKFSFMIDTDTGATWQLATHKGDAADGSDDYSLWQKL